MIWFLSSALATELSVDEAMTIAVARNPTQQAVQLAETIAAISETRARLDRLVGQLSVDAGGSSGAIKPWGEPGYRTTQLSLEGRATVGVPLYTGGRIDAQIDRAAAGAELARLDVRLGERDLERAAYTAWWNIRGFELQIGASEEGLQNSRMALDIIRSKADAGLAAGIDVNRSTVDLYSQEESLIALRAARYDAEQELLRLLHLEPGEPLVLTGELPSVTEGAAVLPVDPLAHRPEIARQTLSVDQASADVRIARSAALPSVSLTGSAGMLGASSGGGPDVAQIDEVTGLPLFDATSGEVLMGPPDPVDVGDLFRPTVDLTVGVQLTWNPFDLLRTRQAVRQATLSTSIVEANNVAERDRLSAELRTAANRVTALRQRKPLVDRQVELARDNQTIIQDLYAQGSATILDLFNAQSAFRQSAIQSASLAVDLSTAELDLKWLLGDDLLVGARP